MSATITPFLDDRAAFDDAATHAMGEAYDRAILALDAKDRGRPSVVQEALAKRIIEIAKTGERKPDQIYQQALAAFGLDRDAS
jgi:hypothetical protein